MTGVDCGLIESRDCGKVDIGSEPQVRREGRRSVDHVVPFGEIEPRRLMHCGYRRINGHNGVSVGNCSRALRGDAHHIPAGPYPRAAGTASQPKHLVEKI